MSLNKLIEKITNETLLVEAPRYKQEIQGLEPIEDYSQRQNYWHLKLKKYENDPLAFVTFSTIPKLGINPKNTWGTPTGIYGYPLDKTKKISSFATDRPYALVFKPKVPDSILIFENYDADPALYDEDVGRLKDFFEQKRGFIYDFLEFEKQARVKAKIDSPSGWLWNLTRLLSQYIVDQTLAVNPNAQIKSTFQWSQIMYNVLGYEGAYDNKGTGLIHENEPYQAVFFRSDVVELVELINKTDKERIDNPGFALKKNKQKLIKSQLKNKLKTGKTIKDENFTFRFSDPGEFNSNSATFINCHFSEGTLSFSNFINVKFENCIFETLKLSRCKFENCKFKQCRFDYVYFANTEIKNCDFNICLFEDIFLRSEMKNTHFEETDFYKTKLNIINLPEMTLDIHSLNSLADPKRKNIVFDVNGNDVTTKELEKYAEELGLTT